MASKPSAPPTHRPANTYEPYEMVNLRQNADTALEENLLAGSDYITEVLVQNQVSYAPMGGLSLRLRGSTRGTQDVDIAVGCNMNRLLEVICTLERVRRPAGPTAGVMRIFVTVGEQLVGVDFILQGSLGVPDDLSTATDSIIAVTPITGEPEFKLLDVKGILLTKLTAFFARASESDFTDLEFVGRNMAPQVYAARQELNAEHRQAFINAYSRRYNSVNTNGVRRLKHVFGAV